MVASSPGLVELHRHLEVGGSERRQLVVAEADRRSVGERDERLTPLTLRTLRTLRKRDLGREAVPLDAHGAGEPGTGQLEGPRTCVLKVDSLARLGLLLAHGELDVVDVDADCPVVDVSVESSRKGVGQTFGCGGTQRANTPVCSSCPFLLNLSVATSTSSVASNAQVVDSDETFSSVPGDAFRDRTTMFPAKRRRSTAPPIRTTAASSVEPPSM